MGHTRVIIDVKAGKTDDDTTFTFYQGTLPAVIPVKKRKSSRI